MKNLSNVICALLIGSTVAIATAAHAAMPASSLTFVVPGDANPWLAGMPAGSTASGDSVPQPPVQVIGVNLLPGAYLTFTGVAGETSYSGDCPGPQNCFGADGDVGGQTEFLSGSPGFINRAVFGYGNENGVSDVTAPLGSLIGVYLGNSQPDPNAAPSALDFRASAIGLNFITLNPGLQQAFFIGDGLTALNETQRFFVPAGATRLYLGTMDGFGWTGNNGALTITASSAAPVPEPETYALLLSGLCLLGIALRRNKPVPRFAVA